MIKVNKHKLFSAIIAIMIWVTVCAAGWIFGLETLMAILFGGTVVGFGVWVTYVCIYELMK